jgi:beta-galactosidase
LKATYEWKKYGAPFALSLECDRPSITADGSDLNRIVVSAVDSNGTLVDNCEAAVTFSLDGMGQLIGENPLKLRAGKMIVLAQSAFVPGQIQIRAIAEGLRTATLTFNATPVPAGFDMPKKLPARQPTRRSIIAQGLTSNH